MSSLENIVTVIERYEQPRSRETASADRLVIAPTVVAVVDGSTPKPWEKGTPFDGWSVADRVARTVEHCAELHKSGDRSISWATELTTGVASLGDPDRWPVESRGCATIAVLDGVQRLVWRIGDPWVMINGRIHAPRPTSELLLAQRRAELVTGWLQQGVSMAELRRHDPSRLAMLEDFRNFVRHRNDQTSAGYGAIDGLPVPPQHIEMIRLPPDECEVVLATDGYPEVCSTLKESERRLRDRLDCDPLLIGKPPQTKGVALGADSFDDRTYVRCTLRAQVS